MESLRCYFLCHCFLYDFTGISDVGLAVLMLISHETTSLSLNRVDGFNCQIHVNVICLLLRRRAAHTVFDTPRLTARCRDVRRMLRILSTGQLPNSRERDLSVAP